MALSTLTQFAAILATLTFNIKPMKSAGADPRLAEELKCLRVSPSEQANLAVTYGPPLNTLQCDQVVPEKADKALEKQPTIKMMQNSQPISKGILVMFDPDAPMTSKPEDGFIHWIAHVTVDKNGDVQIGKVEQEYYKPSPPRGRGPHRYQFFLFEYKSDKALTVGRGRQFQLCPFLKSNNLGQPVAATQYIYELGK